VSAVKRTSDGQDEEKRRLENLSRMKKTQHRRHLLPLTDLDCDLVTRDATVGYKMCYKEKREKPAD